MTSPLVRHADDIEYEPTDAAPGLRKGVLIAEVHGAPNFAIRRFTLEAGAEVPKHTNEVEHEPYVLSGEHVVGTGGEEYEVSAGDSMLIRRASSTGTGTRRTSQARPAVPSPTATTRSSCSSDASDSHVPERRGTRAVPGTHLER